MDSSQTRVLLCCGSESGNTKRLVNKTVRKWSERGATFKVDVMTGNEAIQKFESLPGLAKNFDVLLVATCSYGCGEPPVNMKLLFDLLVDNGEVGSLSSEGGPLKGMQHAILGCGSTCYETFQNCPRLHDKYIGDCGSRRMVMRAELDDTHDLMHHEQPEYLRWESEVFAALQKALPAADSPSACTWDQPCGTITATMSASTSSPKDVAPFVMSAAVAAFGVVASASWALGYFESLPVWMESGIGPGLLKLMSS